MLQGMNTSPIFVSGIQNWWFAGANGSVVVSAVNTGTTAASYDGTTNATLLLTAGTKGSFIQKLVLEAAGPTGNATASVLRVHINNGSTNATATNNVLYMQYSLPITTVSNTTATAHIEIPLMLQLEPGFKLYVSLGSSANLAGGWFITAVGGDY